MKLIEVEFTNEQCEALEQISKLCNKNAPDFIKEAMICLLPLNEYAELKHNLVKLKKEKRFSNNNSDFEKMSQDIKNVNASTSERLRRLGIMEN